MDNSRNRHNEHLGVNKIGKNIRKSPLHQPNFANTTARQQPQPQVYNINKNDFRNIVQQLTGSPSQEPLPRPPHNPPKPPSMRLQRIRPPPLTPINRPQIPVHPQPPVLVQPPPAAPVPYNNNLARPPQYGQPPPAMLPPMTHSDSVWANTAESPISAYMRYLQNSIIDSGQTYPNHPGQQQPHYPGSFQVQPPPSGLLPNSSMPPLQSPRMNGPPPLPSPRMSGPPPLPSPRMNGAPPLPAPRMNGPPPLLPSPTSQFLLPSPTGFLNLLSPRSPYPLLSPGYQFPPLTPNFSFSPMVQSGILGPGPPSPGTGFPLSPSGFFPIPSPRWRNQLP
ncbi:hypothetical protein RJ639_000723 [Escallonia herrerae]|uniref:VQ domain-containing protein n=1 Tax=Escallonia herrerae TaxID=1293975 RepID=A0AA88X8J9_9ASTE|nr:hypothetical protein RJ639_000723 [Escallonia herrerae]